MKKKCVLLILSVFTVIYLVTCFYLLGTVDSVKRKVDRLMMDRGLSPEKIDIAHQLMKPDCVCHSPIVFATHNEPHIVQIQAAELDKQTCFDLSQHRSSADIQVSSLYSKLQLRYDNYQFHHRGWISHYEDVSYSSSQWDTEPLEVYIVPFSHQDPGWRSTMESLYKQKSKIALDKIMENLSSDASMTFVWSEIILLQKWYQTAGQLQKDQLIKLLSAGQLEIVTGAWIMSDEAVSHYEGMLDQLIEGQQWLFTTLNYTARAAWSLDPFGVSPVMAYLLRRSGIYSHLVQRVHYNIKRALADHKQLEFLWRQNWDPGYSTDLFTHMPPFLLYNILYNCGPDPEICCQFDFTKENCYTEGKYKKPDAINDENIEEKAWTLLDQLRKKAQFFKHHKLLMLYGDDFRFYDSKDWTSLNTNIKRLVEYMNSQENMHVKLKFTTLSGYFEAVKSTLSLKHLSVPSVSGDFFTYNDRDDQYWSGYFTSRPMYKYLVRKVQEKLKSTEILFSLLSGHANKQGYDKSVHLLSRGISDIQDGRRALGLAHHHDAITGTSKSAVMNDYFKRLYKVLDKLNNAASKAVSFLVQPTSNIADVYQDNLYDTLDFKLGDHQPIISKLLVKDYNVIAVFNPLASDREEFITVTTMMPYTTVEDINENLVDCQMAPLWNSQTELTQDRFKLTFRAKLAALSVTRFYIKRSDKQTPRRCNLASVRIVNPIHQHQIESEFHIEWSGLHNIELETPLVKVYLCGCTGLLQGVLTKDNQIYHDSRVSFVHYGTGSWTNPLQDKSGAYIFLPNGPARSLEVTQPNIMIVEGPLVKEVRTVLSMVTHTLTLYNSTGPKGASLHMANTVNLSGFNNTELAMRISTDVNSLGVFHTDNNGFQMARRTYFPKYKIQGNYYPITTQIYVEDSLFRATLHTSYGHGASSLNSGELEVMLDRRLSQDDWRGLDAGVLDNVPTPSQFILLWETRHRPWKQQTSKYQSHPSLLSHQVSLQLNQPAELFVQQRTASLPTSPYLALPSAWPCDVHLVNLRSLGPGRSLDKDRYVWESLLLVRRLAYDCDFVNMYQKCLASKAQLNLDKMFSALEIQNIQETTLTGLPSGSKPHKISDLKVLDLPLMEIKAQRVTLL